MLLLLKRVYVPVFLHQRWLRSLGRFHGGDDARRMTAKFVGSLPLSFVSSIVPDLLNKSMSDGIAARFGVHPTRYPPPLM